MLGRMAIGIGLALAAVGPARAQGEDPQAGPRALLPRAVEMGLARSAAPAAVSAEATVLVREAGGRYAIAEEGSNGVTCYVARDWPESIEPHCFDAEGSRTILPIHLERARLQEQGWATADIDAAIAEGIRVGRFRPPTRPVLSYMLSAEQVLFDQGRRVGAWRPHLMIYYPGLTAADLGLDAIQGVAPAMLFDPGTPMSTIVIPVSDFVHPAPAVTPGP